MACGTRLIRTDVADDGSSFYVMEPMAGGVSQLVIRNLDLGLEIHHDLGNLQTANDGYAGLAHYSVDRSEVVIQPGSLFFGGDRAVGFFPTDGSEPRQLRTSVQESVMAKFVSSNEGYFALRRGDGLATVKREYRRDGVEVSVHEPWSRDLVISQVSDDGAWVVGHGSTGVHVLDASTGDTVFEHAWSSSVDRSTRIHDGRLVLGHGIADADELARCRDKRVVEELDREDHPDGAVSVRSMVDVSAENACLADLRERRLYRTVYDVFDLRALADGRPDHYQVEYGEDPHCGSGDDPFGTLEVRDDRLVYVPRS